MSLGLNLGQGSSGKDLLLPEQTNLNTWLIKPSTDGETSVNVKGTDATFTGINSIAVTSGDTITITGLSSSASVSSVASGSVTPTVSSNTLTFGSSGFCSNIVLSDGTHLPLAEGSGTRVFDISGNGNHGTLSGTSWTTTNSIASHNNLNGFIKSAITEKSAFSGTNCTGAINDDGHLVVTSTADSNVAWTLGLPVQLTGSVTLAYDAVVSDGAGVACNINLNDTGSFWLTSGTGANIPNGSFSGTATISSDQDVGLTFNVYSFLTTGQTVTFSNLTLTPSSGACRFPALINKTKQAITLDGSNDVISFGSTISVTDFVYTSKFKLETTAGNNNVFFSSGSDSSSAMFMTLDGSRLGFQIGSNTIQNFPDGSGDGSDTNQRFIVAGYKTSDSQTGTVNLRDGNVHTVVLTRSGTTIAVDIDDGTVTGTFINMPTDAMTFTQFGKQMTHGAYVKGTIYSSKLESGGSVVHEFNLEENIGTTTIKDSSTNSNDGTLSNATLSSAWGQRIVDSSGTIVPANYVQGHTTITNPSGFVHNGSECGLDLITTDVSASDIASINNASATQTFAKRDATNSELAVQILQYSSALSDAGELARTRAYVS